MNTSEMINKYNQLIDEISSSNNAVNIEQLEREAYEIWIELYSLNIF
jgi:hypothetical protein